MRERLNMLAECLEVLAGDPDGQLASLAGQGCVPAEQYIDELALDYDAIAAAAPGMLADGELTEAACRCAQSVNEYLANMSGAHNAHLWTADALRHSAEWERVREMARECLSLLKGTASLDHDH